MINTLAIAPWEEDYTHVVVGVVAHNDSAWTTYQQYLAKRTIVLWTALGGFIPAAAAAAPAPLTQPF